MLDFILKGGPIMWPLIALSVISLSVILERLYFLLSFRSQRDPFQTSRFFKLVCDGKLKDAFQISQSSRDPLLKTLFESDPSSRTAFQISFQHQAMGLLSQIKRGIPVLDTAITLAPLLGLLGTVLGLINAFSSIGANEITAPIAITGGISEALLATAYGLGVAIVCLIPFNLLTELELKIKEQLEEIGTAVESNLE